ncbi:DUF1543 domain-containing protein [Candidatus Xianfuyuplasma coldseepsis]|uniref:DUF1543 domain-containing protein n=1 Tax=Candidatus Xianfuyuplasma coldseepsis TaxID=2782163 RepID=A0A7L7KNQ8_9MOLU|nr:DUF1543 domain-containing protein [Xianfuyuplasma coldseepsis]QMS84390.1 DUF1543 domain-containing protein [Xianfuyuplasma coldseepsis]
MKQLYMIGVGGNTVQSNIEVHDMQFVYAETLEDCYAVLQHRWYGDSLHIDSYVPLQYIDGYELDFSSTSSQQLYMIVYGGYMSSIIDEIHTYHFVLANTPQEAKAIAKKDMPHFTDMNHVDEIVDVFANAGITCGFRSSTKTFHDNILNHTFIKLQKRSSQS